MTTDPKDDAEPAVKPQVIDLEAEDVTAEPEASVSEQPQPPPPRRKSGPTSRWILGALVMGLLAGGWFYRDVASSYLPTNEMRSLKARIDTLEANAKTTGGQLLAVSAAADQVREFATSVEAAIANAANAQSGLNTRLAAVEKSIQSVKADLDALRAAVASGGTSGGTADSAALAAIGQRLDTLEKDVASLKAGSGGEGDAAVISALRQALSDIRAKIAAGLAYRQELDRIVRVVPSVGGNDELNAHADHGLPNAAGLAAELRADIPTLPPPDKDQASTGSGYWDGFWNAITSIVTIRDIGEADWPALAEEAAKLAEAGDLPQAIARIDAAEGTLPSTLSRWRDRLAARVKLETALEDMAKAVNLVIAARGGDQ
ncbi:MAG: COG4223 family protein [Aestuariivirga sp.]